MPLPMLGAHAALAQRVSNPMFGNPVLESPSYEDMMMEMDGMADGGTGMNMAGDMGMPEEGMPGMPGMAGMMPEGQGMASGMPGQEEDGDLAEDLKNPDIKKEMINFLAEKAKARKEASEKFQAQGLGQSSGMPQATVLQR